MNGTTDCRERMAEDGKPCCRVPAVLRYLAPALCFLVLLGGCDKKALEQARQEAREAKTEVQKLRHSLALAQKEITNVKAELNAVRQSREELQARIDQTGRERDQAVEFAQKAQAAMAAQSSGQMSATASLQRQVAELNALLAEQQKLIDQFQKEPAVTPTVVTPDPTFAADPNEDL